MLTFAGEEPAVCQSGWGLVMDMKLGEKKIKEDIGAASALNLSSQ